MGRDNTSPEESEPARLIGDDVEAEKERNALLQLGKDLQGFHGRKVEAAAIFMAAVLTPSEMTELAALLLRAAQPMQRRG